jgi:Spy/CpxP family protein refolding chaperone
MISNPLQKKLFSATTLLLAGAFAAGTAIAQAQPAPGRFARGVRAAMATLDLSDAQKDKVKAIFASRKDEGMAFHTQAKADREALKAAASAAQPDTALVGAAFLKVRANGEAVKSKMKSVRTEIDAVLTPEQRAKLDGWIAAHRQQRGMLRGAGPAQD